MTPQHSSPPTTVRNVNCPSQQLPNASVSLSTASGGGNSFLRSQRFYRSSQKPTSAAAPVSAYTHSEQFCRDLAVLPPLPHQRSSNKTFISQNEGFAVAFSSQAFQGLFWEFLIKKNNLQNRALHSGANLMYRYTKTGTRRERQIPRY